MYVSKDSLHKTAYWSWLQCYHQSRMYTISHFWVFNIRMFWNNFFSDIFSRKTKYSITQHYNNNSVCGTTGGIGCREMISKNFRSITLLPGAREFLVNSKGNHLEESAHSLELLEALARGADDHLQVISNSRFGESEKLFVCGRTKTKG